METKQEVFVALLDAYEQALESLDDEFSGNFEASDRERRDRVQGWDARWEIAHG